MKENIEVIGERNTDKAARISGLFKSVKRIFFLGFGYAPENLIALGLPANLSKEHEIYGTGKGCTSREIGNIKKKISSKIKDMLIEPIIEDKDCYGILREYLCEE